MSEGAAAAERRIVRFTDVPASDTAAVRNGVEDLYNDVLDVIVLRRAFDAARVGKAGIELEEQTPKAGWANPNVRMPVEDIQLLGTDTPATPTFQAPTGRRWTHTSRARRVTR
jgi:hypothetical protein